ncbi:MAG: polyprenol monophosphomannose synthase [Thermomicrobiales bacterium]|nr:polyprenol monophosphomannose synthase [Thermomicrobiales bacterium]
MFSSISVGPRDAPAIAEVSGPVLAGGVGEPELDKRYLCKQAHRASPSPSVVVVTPTYNERDNLDVMVRQVLALGEGYRILVVDDASPDGTGALADRLSHEFPGRVRTIHRPGKGGLGPAYCIGLRAALESEPEFIAMMDADGSHAPRDLSRLVATAGAYDLVLGSRYVSGGATPAWPARRRLLSRLGGRYARAVLRLPVVDPTSGFRVFQRDALRRIELERLHANGFAFNVELTYRAWRLGFRIAEEPIVFVERAAGSSKLSPRIVREGLGLVWRLRLESLAGRL